MKNRLFKVGILAFVLVFGMMVFGCKDQADDNIGQNNYYDTVPEESGLRGTKWVNNTVSSQVYEFSVDGKTYKVNNSGSYYIVNCIKLQDANIFGTTWYINRMTYNPSGGSTGAITSAITFHVNGNNM
jgi:hypothetical protein